MLERTNTTRAKIHDFSQPPSASCKPRHPGSALQLFVVGSCSQVVLGFGSKSEHGNVQLVGLFGFRSDSMSWTAPQNMHIIVIGLSKSTFQFSVVVIKVLI